MTSDGITKIEGREIKLSNLNKVLFPQSGITKGGLITYYTEMSEWILPFYKNHPLTMWRCPDGINHQQFYQKAIPEYFPDWVERFKLSKKGGYTEHVLINNKATIVYLANQACITFHLNLAQINKPNYPNYL